MVIYCCFPIESWYIQKQAKTMTQSKPLTAAEAAAYPRLFMISETVYDLQSWSRSAKPLRVCKADQGLQSCFRSTKSRIGNMKSVWRQKRIAKRYDYQNAQNLSIFAASPPEVICINRKSCSTCIDGKEQSAERNCTHEILFIIPESKAIFLICSKAAFFFL